MIDAKTPEEALKVITDAGYGYSGEEVSTPFHYEKLLKDEQKKVYDYLEEIAPEPEIFTLFLLKNDYHNIKVLLKGEFSGSTDETLLLKSGTIPLPVLKTSISNRMLTELPDIMAKGIEDCIDTYGRTADPQVIDIILDKACYSNMREKAETSGKDFLKKLIEIYIDLANIKILIRLKALDKSLDFLQKVVLSGGSIPQEVYIECLNEPFEKIIEKFKLTPYHILCEEGINSYLATNSPSRFEKLSDDFIMSFIKKSKYLTLGIEPLVGYLIGKQTEIQNVRIIMVGKINNINNDVIRERLREIYA
jgi:V/A-type H+-transporting ATPase subunit C